MGRARPICFGQVAVWRALFCLSLTLLLFGRAPSISAEVLTPNNDDEIVYFDGDHVIRVYDPKPASSILPLEWASPGGGWGDIALGDLTGDGDMEIVAIRQDGSRGRLTIFDPVAQDSPEDQVEVLNGIPWAILYDVELPRPPRLIATGEFDPSNNRREILYSFVLDDEFDRFVILRAKGEGLPGREWEEQLTWDLEERWTAVATGNVYLDDAIDEVGLVNFGRGELGLFRVEPEVVRTFTNVNREHRWRDVAFGQFVNVNNDGDELGAVRDADDPIASTWLFRYNGSAIIDHVGERHTPSPTVIFFADITGNNDDEMVLLRQVRPELGPRPRLIVRDGNNNDSITAREELLDGDNEYKGGDGGDIDGDGRDEIVVIRNNRIRIYGAPESSAAYTLVERFTNGTTVKLGNLDASGLAPRSRLVVTRTSVDAELEPGQRSGTRTIGIVDATRGVNLPVTIDIQGAAEWIEYSLVRNTTPTTLTVNFNAAGIAPGEYRGTLFVNVSTPNVENAPIAIDLAMTVETLITASPASVDFVCDPDNLLLRQSQTVALSAAEPLPYRLRIDGDADWIAVSPLTGTLPADLTVSVTPTNTTPKIVSFDLLVSVDSSRDEDVIHRVPVLYACTTNRLLLPRIFND